jgi:hypothetical protein
MNSTRIEIPVALTAPHFDDDRTVATARQVKPIGRARVNESWRKLRVLLPLILLATFCGALGAATVNFYEERHTVGAVAQPSPNNSTTEPKVEASPIVSVASADPTPNDADKKTEAGPVEPKTEAASSTDESKAKTVNQSTHDESSDQPPPGTEKRPTVADATKLTRKRRVTALDENAAPTNKKGAGRISDIFSGPNP